MRGRVSTVSTGSIRGCYAVECFLGLSIMRTSKTGPTHRSQQGRPRRTIPSRRPFDQPTTGRTFRIIMVLLCSAAGFLFDVSQRLDIARTRKTISVLGRARYRGQIPGWAPHSRDAFRAPARLAASPWQFPSSTDRGGRNRGIGICDDHRRLVEEQPPLAYCKRDNIRSHSGPCCKF